MDFDKLIRKLEGLQKASRNGHKVKDLHDMMRLDEIWYIAYAKIYANHGALTKGIDEVTLDGFSVERIHDLINGLKAGTYRPDPVRRVYIPKRDGGKRPLGVPSGNDKLVQSVIQILLEQVYDPIFHDTSHGFRPSRSCHTALKQIKNRWTGTKWLIEFDIKGFFDNMDHDIMIQLLEKKIDDKRLVELVRQFLKSGYLEDWSYKPTYSGTPQGGIVSPILSNIYLHELDGFLENLIQEFTVGKRRPVNLEHARITNQMSILRKQMRTEGSDPEMQARLKELQKLQMSIPSVIEDTDKYIRLRYCRYADDFICGVAGSFEIASEIHDRIEGFLEDGLRLELSHEKTGIRRLSRGADFLSFKICAPKGSGRVLKTKTRGSFGNKRTLQGKVMIEVPERKLIEFCNKHGYGDWYQKKAIHRSTLATLSDNEIVEIYNREFRGLANYYSIADFHKQSLGRLAFIWKKSLFKTLARKYKCKMSKIARRLRIPSKGFFLRYELKGKTKLLQVFDLRDMKKTEYSDELPLTAHLFNSGTELIQRLEAEQCEYCGDSDSSVEVHHIHKLRDLKKKSHLENWQKVMIAKQRKTLVLCKSCHNLLHQGKLPDLRQK